MAREIKVALLGDTKSLERAFSKAGDSGSKFNDGMGKVGHGLGAVVKGAALAGVAVAGLGVVIGTKLVQDLENQQRMSVQTNTVLASTGDVSNVTRKHVEDLANAIEKKSGVDGQAVQSGENMLLTFTNIRNEAGKGNKVFDQTTSILADMTVAMGSDPQKQAIQLGKALNDPVKGITALQKVGVTFSESQKKTIAALVKTGDTVGAQKVILGELNKEFGGSARAAGQTLPGKLKILQARLYDFGDGIVAGVIPKLSSFVGFLDKIVKAPNMSVRLKIAWEGISDLGKNFYGQLSDAIAGTKQVLHVHGDAIEIGQEGLADKFRAVFDTIDWASIGHKIGGALGRAIKLGDDALNSILSSITTWIGAHRGRLADLGAQMLTAMVIRLADPAFWVKHWDLALGVALAIGPGKFAKVGGRIGELLLAPLGSLGSKLGGVLVDGFVGAARLAGPKAEFLAIDLLHLLEIGVAKGGEIVGKAALKLGQSIVGKLGAGLNKLGFIAKVLISTALVQAIAAAAVAAYNGAKSLGGRLISGVIDGLQDLGPALKKKIEGTVGGVLSSIDIPGFSPPEHAASEAIGQPLGRGVILGFLAGSADLPDKMSGKVKASLESTRTRIDSLRGDFATSFGQLGTDAMSAFDAATAKGLAKIQAKFDRLREIAKGPDQTPSEKLLSDLQSGHDAEGRAKALSDAQAGLATAQAGGDPQAIIDAQASLNDALYNNQVAALQQRANEERATQDRIAANATASYDKQQAQAELDYQSTRDLQKRHLEAMLADLQENLDKHPKAWRKNHEKIMKMFAEEFGPDFQTAGAALGTGFRDSLIEDFKVTGALLGSVGAAIKNALSSANQSAVSTAVAKANPKKMATGGIVTSPTFALIGEAGPEAVIPLSQMSGGGGNVYVTVQGWVGNDQDIAEKIRNTLIRKGRNTTGGALGGFG